MSDSGVTIRAGNGMESVAFPGVREAHDGGVTVAVPSATAGAAKSISWWQRVFSFPVMLGAFLVAAVFVVGRGFNVDPDVWWHTRAGQIILATHHWPTTDPFSFTVGGQPWIDCEWLGDVLIAPAARIAGVRGLDALLIILGSAIMLALYVYGTLRSGNSKAGFVASTVLFVLASASFSLRPQMLGYLFLILTLIILERFRQGRPSSMWLLPPLFLLWINAHGSFVIGLGIICAYWISGLMEFQWGGIEAKRWSPAERRRISFVFLLCLATLFITPYGSQMAAYPFEVAFKLPMGVATVSEWQPMPFNLPGGKLFLGLLMVFLVIQVMGRFTWRLEEFFLFLFGTLMACLHVRFLLLFVPFFTPLLATILARWVPRYDRAKDRYALNAALMAVVAVIVFRFFPSPVELQKGIREQFPVGAVEYMHQHTVPGPTFNNYNFGTYMIWSGYKVFIDGRSDPYERGGAFADYLYISHLKPGAISVLNAYGIQSCLIQPEEPLATMLATLPEWRKVYADNVSVLFVRQETSEPSKTTLAQTVPRQEERR